MERIFLCLILAFWAGLYCVMFALPAMANVKPTDEGAGLYALLAFAPVLVVFVIIMALIATKE